MSSILPMQAIKLSREQRAALNTAPLTPGLPNKILIALGIVGAPQYRLAEVAGMHPTSISQIANGKYSRIQLDTCQRIARVFGIDCVDELFPMVNNRKRAA